MVRIGVAPIVITLFLGLLLYFFHSQPITPDLQGFSRSPSAIATESYIVPPAGDTYRNNDFGFSLTLPQGFSAQSLPVQNGTHVILLQDTAGKGIQISISPDPNNAHTLTIDDVRRDIPDMRVYDEQPVEIGDDYLGVAFRSDNEAFEGDSREVWFYFRGNLYQISTYAHLDSLLQTMFSTWQFY